MNNIIDPTNGNRVSLFSSQGKALLKQYVTSYQSFKNSQSGGSEEKKQVGGDWDPELPQGFRDIITYSLKEPHWFDENHEGNIKLWSELVEVANNIYKLTDKKWLEEKGSNVDVKLWKEVWDDQLKDIINLIEPKPEWKNDPHMDSHKEKYYKYIKEGIMNRVEGKTVNA